MKTHAERWRDTNRERLAPEQLAMLEEDIAFVKPEHYRGLPATQEHLQRLKELERRNAALFSREEMRQFLTIYGNEG